jgi:hypothetical protein
MRRTIVASGIVGGLALVGASAAPAAAQSRVVVPIVIQAPRVTTSSPARPPSINVSTQTATPQPGVTTTRVTVRDTTGAGRTVGAPAAISTLGTIPTGTPSTLITVDRRLAPDGSGAPGQTRITVEDVSHSNRTLGGPAPLATLRTAGTGQETVIVTSDAPVDTPIVILSR